MTEVTLGISSGDFTAAYDRHVERVYAFFAYVLGSRADAEDLTQQTFERAMRAWARFDGARGSAATWLLAIARNLLIDHLRAARAANARVIVESGLEEIPAPPDRPRLGLDPDLERALAALAPRDREVIALRFGGDLTTPEIGTLTGLSAGNVQQILSRSLRRMRTSLDSIPVGAGS